jgi:hypothetical protein
MLGDFNLICQESNKNSGAVDRNLMHRFMKSIELLVKEIQLTGRKYTWSNRQSNPTMSQIDRDFCIVLRER